MANKSDLIWFDNVHRVDELEVLWWGGAQQSWVMYADANSSVSSRVPWKPDHIIDVFWMFRPNSFPRGEIIFKKDSLRFNEVTTLWVSWLIFNLLKHSVIYIKFELLLLETYRPRKHYNVRSFVRKARSTLPVNVGRQSRSSFWRYFVRQSRTVCQGCLHRRPTCRLPKCRPTLSAVIVGLEIQHKMETTVLEMNTHTLYCSL